MERLSFTLPAMYGDHHVLEVRRILLEMTGIQEVNASSCFHVVEVLFDPAFADTETVKARLEEAGYFRELPTPHEIQGTRNGNSRTTRPEPLYHSDEMVTFVQVVSDDSAIQLPCPGMGVLGKVERG